MVLSCCVGQWIGAWFHFQWKYEVSLRFLGGTRIPWDGVRWYQGGVVSRAILCKSISCGLDSILSKLERSRTDKWVAMRQTETILTSWACLSSAFVEGSQRSHCHCLGAPTSDPSFLFGLKCISFIIILIIYCIDIFNIRNCKYMRYKSESSDLKLL